MQEETAQTFYYNHKKNSWSEGSALNHARFYHAVGVAIDEETKEKLVIVTGGSISNTKWRICAHTQIKLTLI